MDRGVSATESLLASCADEPIRTPGTIQPHGALAVLRGRDLVCTQASANAGEWFGLSELLGARLEDFAPAAARAIRMCGAGAEMVPLVFEVPSGRLAGTIHRSDAGWILECEQAPAGDAWYADVSAAVARLGTASDLETLAGMLAAQIAHLTGFDRVMVYRFDEDWHGWVIAEHLGGPVESYLGHHFPESDIPAQARDLYSRCLVRVIPDASYVPVPIFPAVNPDTGEPLDLGCAMLRSVSPVHLEYLQNMAVGASMSVSLMSGERLWGLVACHHRSPRRVPADIRTACELIGRVASLEITTHEERRRLGEYIQAARVQTRFFDVIAGEPNVFEALLKYMPRLLDLLGAGGAAICIAGRTTVVGETPPTDEIARLVEWLEHKEAGPVFSTHTLSREFPPAAAVSGVASGLLAARLSRVEPHYVLWFRPEVFSTIKWAGRPGKISGDAGRLHPRTSFEAWHETVRQQSRPWGDAEREAAHELVYAINALVLRRTERLLTLNAELERKNIDLNSFAYIAAHDLKEPLRGIATYCRFFREDHGDALSQEALRKLDTISELASHSSELIDALNHYSKIGRLELDKKTVPLDDVVDTVLVALDVPLRECSVEVIRSPLPVVSCDPVLVREVFLNLVTNAIRYNDKASRVVEIGCSTRDGSHVFFVRDNGIGIPERHFDAIFHIFRRLHTPDIFGGGTGAGLAIVRAIVERHGGSVRVESVPNEGSTFFFTLG